MLFSLKSKRLDLAFGCACFSLLVIPVIFPSVRLLFFAPCLVIFYYQRSLLASLWASLICGFIVDTLSCTPQFGIYALNYCLCTAFLYPQKRNFFADSISTLPLMTLLFSLLSTTIDGIFNIYSLSWHWFVTDFFLMPFGDALYALCIFLLPSVRFKEEYSL